MLQNRLLFHLDQRAASDQSLEDILLQKGYSSKDIVKADVLFAQTNCTCVGDLSMRDLCRDATVDRSGPGYEALRLVQFLFRLLRAVIFDIVSYLFANIRFVFWLTW